MLDQRESVFYIARGICMASETLIVIMILALMVWRSLFEVLHRRPLHREIVTSHRTYDTALERRFQILERACAGGIAESGFDPGSDEVCRFHRRGRTKVYLRRIVALSGATQTDEGYILDVGKTRFYVCDRYVRRLRDSTNPQYGYDETCFYCVHKGMPSEEEIASALLQLKNNPRLFDKWAMKNGLAFKANGQVFTHGL